LDRGEGCENDIYAVSLPGVTPSANLTQFQARIACKNAGKRLPTNAEWQVAVTASPDPGTDNGTSDCNTTSTTFMLPEDPVLTGSRSSCTSAFGAHDMVGNLAEWVADWVPRSTACGAWGGSGDSQCFAGAATTSEPGGLVRGGAFASGTNAGPLSVTGGIQPSGSFGDLGFRCAR
jgi:formylglycine-generating enzyme required for sulfatase activity